MKLLPFVTLALLVTSQCGMIAATDSMQPLLDALNATIGQMAGTIEGLKRTVYRLGRQTMLQQFAMEENLRSQVDSGVGVIRGGARGFKSYERDSNIGDSVNAIHNHANLKTTLGMGEVTVTMNGIFFRTRHNDYKIIRASTTSTEFGATQYVRFPGVPPEVKGTIEEQIEEMREWFRSFHTQNTTLRDYRKYFKPLLCYLEGLWTAEEEMQEILRSDRHFLEASSWVDLQEKIRFSGYSGVSNSRENWAYLPTSIIEMNETTGEPVYAQWNYRILCHPIQRDIPLSMLQQVDDLRARVASGRTLEKLRKSPAGRFKLYDPLLPSTYNILDHIFYTIPGMDNLPGDCQQTTFKDGNMYQANPGMSHKLLNTCYYHRHYQFSKDGAMGLPRYSRGFNDANLWVAQNHQPQVAGLSLRNCWRGNGGSDQRNCSRTYNRFTYAIPLEIVFLTPLLSWNPYNLTVHKKRGKASEGGRNGANLPYDGVDSSHYYLTPIEFFKSTRDISKGGSAADTSRTAVQVLDPQGVVRRVRASGTPIFLNPLPCCGRIRLRYPIAPMKAEGSNTWKELEAFKDMILHEHSKDDKDQDESAPPSSVHFRMAKTFQDPPGEHTHDLIVTFSQFKAMRNGGVTVNVTTSMGQGHTHDLQIIYNTKKSIYKYTKCDQSPKCRDNHPHRVRLITRNTHTMP